jgi:hypothetical protein
VVRHDIFIFDAVTTIERIAKVEQLTGWQLEQRRRLCKIVSAKETPEGETLRELRSLQDALRGVFSDEGWKQSGIMLRYPFGG